MKNFLGFRVATGLAVAFIVTACSTTTRESRPQSVDPAVPERADRPAASAVSDSARPGYTEADVRFMQGMIHHHAQALEMTSLVPERSSHRGVRLLAERIEVSQKSEIARMQRWLRERGEEVPSADPQAAHHGGGAHALMPGMLTREEMDRLAAATGVAFDRLFLESMIRHHEGALVMVSELFSSRGAAQQPETFQLASEIDADQRMEIARMRSMLNELSSGTQNR